MIISVDYDNTIVKHSWPGTGKLRWLAKPVLRRLFSHHTLILNTCRHDDKLSEAVWFCNSNGIYFDYFNSNTKEMIEQYGDCRKIGADIYLDDKAFFPGWLLTAIIIWWMERVKK